MLRFLFALIHNLHRYGIEYRAITTTEAIILDKNLINLIRRELLKIRFGSPAESLASELYLLGFLQCAVYYSHLLTRERYALASELVKNAREHHYDCRMRKAA